jgi:hypothetical protein
MLRPEPKKHAECDQCLRDMPLLMPVAWIPGWPFVAWEHLCLECRCSMQLSRGAGDRYGEPGYIWEHSDRPGSPGLRPRYLEFMANDPETMCNEEPSR